MQKNLLLERMKSKLAKLKGYVGMWYPPKDRKKDRIHQLRAYLKREINNLIEDSYDE